MYCLKRHVARGKVPFGTVNRQIVALFAARRGGRIRRITDQQIGNRSSMPRRQAQRNFGLLINGDIRTPRNFAFSAVS